MSAADAFVCAARSNVTAGAVTAVNRPSLRRISRRAFDDNCAPSFFLESDMCFSPCLFHPRDQRPLDDLQILVGTTRACQGGRHDRLADARTMADATRPVVAEPLAMPGRARYLEIHRSP